MKRNENSLRDLWDNIKYTNIHTIGVPGGEERERGAENVFEAIIAENFPNLEKKTVTQVQEAQTVPYRINPKRNTPRHIVIQMIKIKDKKRILKATRKKQEITHKGSLIRLSAGFSAETSSQSRRQWHAIFKVTKGKNLQPRIFCPEIFCLYLSFRFDGEIKSFTDKQS